MNKKLIYLTPQAEVCNLGLENTLLTGSPTGFEGNAQPGIGEDWGVGLSTMSTDLMF